MSSTSPSSTRTKVIAIVIVVVIACIGLAIQSQKSRKLTLEEMAQAAKDNPEDLEGRLQYAEALLQNGDRETAIKVFFTANEISATDPRSSVWLGILFEQQKDYMRAVLWYQEALKRDPKNTDVLVSLAQVLQ